MRILLATLLLPAMTTGTAAAPSTAWFEDARFGLFVHFGLYSVPAGVWEGQRVGRASSPRGCLEKQAAQEILPCAIRLPLPRGFLTTGPPERLHRRPPGHPARPARRGDKGVDHAAPPSRPYLPSLPTFRALAGAPVVL